MKAVQDNALVIRMPPSVEMDDEQFFHFCRVNRDLRIERTAGGEIEIMPPTGWDTGRRNMAIAGQLWMWAQRDGTGSATDSSTGFNLPDGATRAPDAAWVRRERLAGISAEQRQRFLPLCPDFVIELRSPSDSLDALRDKMKEYMKNGARLGWLLDAPEKRCYVYRPGIEVELLENPAILSAEPELPGFTLDLAPIWNPVM